MSDDLNADMEELLRRYLEIVVQRLYQPRFVLLARLRRLQPLLASIVVGILHGLEQVKI